MLTHMREQPFSHPQISLSLLTDVLGEAGHPLSGTTLRIMEDGLCADFGDVVIHSSDLSHRANAALGTLAFTIGSHICFSRNAYDPESRCGRLLLAHELAHVVQARLGMEARSGASAARRIAAEIEADAAAVRVLQGRRHACSVPLPVGQLSAWGPAGHYYTVYYVLLAAGVANAEAARLAFYTQMPDEVWELDAEAAGRDFIHTADDGTGGDTPQDLKDARRRNTMELLREKERCEIIQMGLHCLTGRDSRAETEARRQVLDKCADDKFAFGLGLHPLGDSFAHRKLDNERVMYSSWLGHGVEWPRREHVPDKIHMRPGLYREYVRVLFHLACAKWPDAKRRVVWEVGDPGDPHGTRSALSAAIETIARETSDEAQIETIRRLSRESLGQEMNRYQPESKRNPKVPWKEFSKKHGLAIHLFERALLLAKDWRFVSKNVRVPVASGSGQG